MNKLEQAARQSCQTPLKDLLRSVPKDGRDCYEEDSTCHHFIPYGRLIHESLAEIERLEALAEQAEQEPVAWMNDSAPMGVFARHKEGAENFGCTIPLYAAPVRTKDLTDDEIASIGSELAAKNCVSDIAFARAVIAADREKNK